MGIQDFGTMDPNASLKQVIGELANLMDTLNFLLNGQLDIKNIRADSLTARVIKANSITADKLNVTQLSAITADLGHIMAGLIEAVDIVSGTITGAIIKTSTGNARMQLDTGFLTQYDSSNNVMAQFGSGSLPYLALYASGGFAGGVAGLFTSIFGLSIDTTALTDMPIRINAGAEVINIIGDRVNITAPNGLWVNGVRIA